MKLPMEVITAMSSITLILLGIIGYFLKQHIESINKYKDFNEADKKDIRENYVDRFDGLNEKMNEANIKLARIEEAQCFFRESMKRIEDIVRSITDVIKNK